MSFEVYLQRNFVAERLDVYLIERVGGDQVRWHGPGGIIGPAAENVRVDAEPFASLPADAAHALLAALSRHLGAVEHPEQLRADYDRLWARHDRLVDHVMHTAEARRR